MACQLHVQSGPRTGEVITVENGPFTLGRDPRCNLQFDPQQELMVSGRHARLTALPDDGWELVDTSSNGTFVNGTRVQRTRLRSGDIIELGPGGPHLRFEAEALAASSAPDPVPSRIERRQDGLRATVEAAAKPAEPHHPTLGTTGTFGRTTLGQQSLELVLERLSDGERLRFAQRVVRLGRDPGADCPFDAERDLLVSHQHAKILALGGQVVLFDSDSTNGTFVDGVRVSRCTLRGGEVLELGRGGPRLRVESATVAEAVRPTTTAPVPSRGGDTVFARGTPELTDLSLGEADLLGEHTLDRPLTIGRNPGCAILLDSMFVSGVHAVVERQDGVATLRDRGSANGTFLDGQRITQARLVPGTEFLVGPFVLKYSGQSVRVFDTRRRTWLSAEGLTRVDRRSGRAFLDGVSLRIRPGEFVCILGPSGCGKSTLLRAITGLRPADDGRVLLNGIDFYAHHEQLKHQVGFVPQDDIIHRHLSIYRTLVYAARLRLPRSTSPDKRRERLEAVLSALELHDHRHKPISALSGGQRKRVNMAVELLTDPSILFLDEPTSGLDPNLEEKMMLLFREMTHKGMTVVAVTHTLDNIQLCDKVCFLVDGHLVFFGTPDEGRAFFRVDRLPEVYKRFDERRGDIKALRAEFEASSFREAQSSTTLTSEPARLPAVPTRTRTRQRPGPLGQVLTLSGRYLELISRDLRNTAILLLQAPIVALFIVLAVRSDQPERGPTSTLLLIMSLSALWFGCSNAAREITKESAIFARERLFNLGVWPYVASKVLVLQLLSLVQVALMLFIVHALRGGYTVAEPPPACVRWGVEACSTLILPGVPGSLGRHLLTLYLTALNGIGLGLLVSALAGNSDKAMSLVPLILIPQVLFSGSFGVTAPDETLKRAVGYTMTLNWSLDQAKRTALCSPEEERPAGAPGAGCRACLHGHDPFKHRRLGVEAQDDDRHCLAVLPMLGQMTEFPEALELVEDGLYTPRAAHATGEARLATRSWIGQWVLLGYALVLFLLVGLVVGRTRERG